MIYYVLYINDVGAKLWKMSTFYNYRELAITHRNAAPPSLPLEMAEQFLGLFGGAAAYVLKSEWRQGRKKFFFVRFIFFVLFYMQCGV